MIAFGGLELGARRRRRARRRARPARAARWPRPARSPSATARRRPACRRARSASATSRSPTGPICHRCSTASTSRFPAGSSLAIVGVNGAGKTTLAKLLCRLYDPQAGSDRDRRRRPARARPREWRARITAVFQDFVRYELSLRDNVAPRGAPDADDRRGARATRAPATSPTSTPCSPRRTRAAPTSPAASGNASRSRARCARCGCGAGVVLLDEPTAQLDVRGEAEIFERVLAATRPRTTILVSHRFSTVRQADRICVVEHGRVVELGTHDELMAARRPLPARCSSCRRRASSRRRARRARRAGGA